MGMSGFRFQMEDNQVKVVDDMQPSGSNLPYMKVEDAQYFSKLLVRGNILAWILCMVVY